MGTPHPLRSLALANHPLPQRQRATVPVRPRHESALLLRLASQRVRDSVEREPTVSRTNVLYLVIGALAVAVAISPRVSISTSARAACRSKANEGK